MPGRETPERRALARGRPTRRDLAGFVDSLVDAYAALFAHPRLDARLGVYEALWHLPAGAGRGCLAVARGKHASPPSGDREDGLDRREEPGDAQLRSPRTPPDARQPASGKPDRAPGPGDRFPRPQTCLQRRRRPTPVDRYPGVSPRRGRSPALADQVRRHLQRGAFPLLGPVAFPTDGYPLEAETRRRSSSPTWSTGTGRRARGLRRVRGGLGSAGRPAALPRGRGRRRWASPGTHRPAGRHGTGPRWTSDELPIEAPVGMIDGWRTVEPSGAAAPSCGRKSGGLTERAAQLHRRWLHLKARTVVDAAARATARTERPEDSTRGQPR